MFEFLVHYIIFYLSGDRWLRSTTTFVIHLISSEWAFPKPSHLQNYAESVGVDPNTFHSTNGFQDRAVGRYSSLSNICICLGTSARTTDGGIPNAVFYLLNYTQIIRTQICKKPIHYI